MSKSLVLEGLLATVDVLAQLTAQGSVTAPSRVVPAGVTKIKSLFAFSASDGTADGASVTIIELSGPAVLGGSQRIGISGHGATAGQAGSDEMAALAGGIRLLNVDIAVRAGDVINVSAVMA